jgi:hypothetical protein
MSVRVEEGFGKFKVFAEIFELGEDIIILVGGGEKPHVGSIAVAIPRESRKEKGKMSCTSSVYNFLGHKDEEIVRKLAEKICIATKRLVVCAGGVHVENASESDIEILLRNSERLGEKLVRLMVRSFVSN